MFSGRNVDVIEERLPHEAVVAVDRVLRHRPVFVEIERDDVREIERLLPMQADQLAIHADRRRAGRQPQHGLQAGRVVLADQAFDDEGHVPIDLARVAENQRGDFGLAEGLSRSGLGLGFVGGASGAISMAMLETGFLSDIMRSDG